MAGIRLHLDTKILVNLYPFHPSTRITRVHLLTSYHSRLRSLIVYGITDDNLLHNLHFATQVHQLSLWHCGLSFLQIHAILINCVALKELSIGHLSLLSVDSRFIPASILDSLMHLKDTLESLTLIDEDGQNHSIGHSFPLPRIAGFNKLHTIDVTADLLLGQAFAKPDPESVSLHTDDMFRITDFPQSITRLTFREMRADLIQYLMLSDSDSQMPNLKTIHVQFISGQELNDETKWLAIARAYEKRGIVLTLKGTGC